MSLPNIILYRDHPDTPPMTPHGNPDTPLGEDEYEITTLLPHYDQDIDMLYGLWLLLKEKKVDALLESTCRIDGKNVAVHIVIEPRVNPNKDSTELLKRIYAASIAYVEMKLHLYTYDFRFEDKEWSIEDPRFKFENVVEYVIRASRSLPSPEPHPQYKW